MKKRKFAEGGSPEMSESYTAEPDSFVGPKISDKEAFRRKFAQERAKGSKTFEWKGKTITTALASDKAKPKAAAPAPDQSQAETNRLRRQDDAAGPSMSNRPEKPKREMKLPEVEYTDEMNDALMTAMGGAGLARKLGKELTRAGALRAEAGIREGSRALKEASQKAKYVRDFTKDKEPVLGFKKGGAVSASRRGDGIAQRGKTRGKLR